MGHLYTINEYLIRIYLENEPQHNKTNKAALPKSNQSLLCVKTLAKQLSYLLSYLFADGRFWSDWADAQALRL